MKEYYRMSNKEAIEEINGDKALLTDEQIKKNQELYGWNKLVEEKQKSAWMIFLEQFNDFLVIILILAAIVSGMLKEIESSIVILVVILMNAILGTVQTLKSRQSIDALKKMAAPDAKVIRNHEVIVIPSKEVTIGDIVVLEAGDFVPSDGRIMKCESLTVDESALTGESVAVEKMQEMISREVSLGDRRNMVYSGSYVSYGRGYYLVTAIGMQTEIGKIASLIKNVGDKKTPLQVNLDNFGKRLSIAIVIFCFLIFVVSTWRGETIANAFLFAVALAVAAIPEALSSIVTIVLSFGMQKMASENAIVRKLQAVEGLGSVSVICSDKTGTLTKNQMSVLYYYVNESIIESNHIDLSKSMHEKLLLHSILCNDANIKNGKEIGDPTETALLQLAYNLDYALDANRNLYPRQIELPFDSNRKMMSTVHLMQGKFIMITKGAVDVMLKKTTYIEKNGDIKPFTQDDYLIIEKNNKILAEQGLRVLAFGYKIMLENTKVTFEDENDFVFLGLIAMMDPPREESKKAVQDCMNAGIRPIMITGDHKITAMAIAKKIGILQSDEQACEGSKIDQMNDDELRNYVENISVYARVSPEHKIRIVKAWQDKGNIVAMTGDGVNDAPALKQADIGVSMGITGTEVAKDASSMILTDDNFATIVKAVENGRNVYRNIKNAILFLLSGNFGAILTVLYASIMNLALPFSPVHLLFINLLTDSLPAIALGLEPHTSKVMKETPRSKNDNILSKEFLIRVGIEGSVISFVTIIAYHIGLQESAVLASTFAFGTLCISRLFHGFNCKSRKPVIFTKIFFNNTYLLMSFIIGFILITSILMIPNFETMFKVHTVNVAEMGIIYGMSFLSLCMIQCIKWITNKIL